MQDMGIDENDISDVPATGKNKKKAGENNNAANNAANKNDKNADNAKKTDNDKNNDKKDDVKSEWVKTEDSFICVLTCY